MHDLSLGSRPFRRVLCLGAHCDDIEIGCGGTLLTLLEHSADLAVDWVVFTGTPERAAETRAAAAELLTGARETNVIVRTFADGYLPAELAAVKSSFAELSTLPAPDLILTHYRGDLHQDHRAIGELTWQTFRNHLIWEYEIPKYDGDTGRPNVYMPLTTAVLERKIGILMNNFTSQRTKPWFSADTFRALPRLRGLESGTASGWAEAFHGPKMVVRP